MLLKIYKIPDTPSPYIPISSQHLTNSECLTSRWTNKWQSTLAVGICCLYMELTLMEEQKINLYMLENKAPFDSYQNYCFLCSITHSQNALKVHICCKFGILDIPQNSNASNYTYVHKLCTHRMHSTI